MKETETGALRVRCAETGFGAVRSTARPQMASRNQGLRTSLAKPGFGTFGTCVGSGVNCLNTIWNSVEKENQEGQDVLAACHYHQRGLLDCQCLVR